ncbi:hypothetical protein CHLNCDRAFT_134182 [Chlorella variabilis]|uniref:Uncharacterized protein n=1 Tax=Chlorella variabilis TaxID=554065 RepID=E1ZGB8_CHLVA|nr:hypothetical protein CHLNCDRAFT_134182 [Chlorella variabilis]EFN55127.1 hypothetical protein CHLNCDRAFT_134182 [Chlorella variabilis]|eukprot:XP_005847229.1 hypothetical protein CHLNCDRAFT_134182 [Chlorella variabilis]
MSTSENASLRFGPMPARTRQPSSSASPASGGPAAGGERRGSGRRGSERRSSAAAGQQQQQQQQPAEVAAWQAECERVKDRLVITADAGGGGGEWRIPLERALASMGSLQATEPEARAELEGAGQALAATAEALAASDKAVSSQLSGLQAEHQAAVAAVDSLQAEQAARQEYVATLEQELQFLNKELEERQREMAEQGNSMSDKRPVARLAEACSQLRTELLQMEVRTGILQAMLLRQATAKR